MMNGEGFYDFLLQTQEKLKQGKTPMQIALTAKAEQLISESPVLMESRRVGLICSTSWADVPPQLICFPDDPARRKEVQVFQKSWASAEDGFFLIALDV